MLHRRTHCRVTLAFFFFLHIDLSPGSRREGQSSADSIQLQRELDQQGKDEQDEFLKGDLEF